MRGVKENIVKDKSFQFALNVIELYKRLIEENEFVISRQLLKSGTSIGANIVEAGAAQSKADFVSKMSIASKEARETEYWLQLLTESRMTEIDLSTMLAENTSLIKLITSIVKTAKENMVNSKSNI